MIQEIDEVTWGNILRCSPNFCQGLDLETLDEYAEYFAKAMRKVCKYQVYKGEKAHINVFQYDGEMYEDRDYYFIDMSFRSFLRAIDAPEKHCERSRRIRIRNMAIDILTKHLRRCY